MQLLPFQIRKVKIKKVERKTNKILAEILVLNSKNQKRPTFLFIQNLAS